MSASAGGLTWWGCLSIPTVFYRVNPMTDDYFETYSFRATLSPTSPTDILSGLNTPSPTSTSTSTPPNTAPSDSTPTSSPISSPAPTKAASKAWIAGVVVGSLGFIAIAGVVFFLLRRRRQNQGQTYQVAPQTSTFSPPQPNGEGFLMPMPPPGVHDGMSDTTGSNTYSMYSASGSGHGAVGPPMTAASMQDLPELVQTPRR
jgi:hypothetical protein